MKAHMGLIPFCLAMKSSDQEGFQLLNPIDILKFLYYCMVLLCHYNHFPPVILYSLLL